MKSKSTAPYFLRGACGDEKYGTLRIDHSTARKIADEIDVLETANEKLRYEARELFRAAKVYRELASCRENRVEPGKGFLENIAHAGGFLDEYKEEWV